MRRPAATARRLIPFIRITEISGLCHRLAGYLFHSCSRNFTAGWAVNEVGGVIMRRSLAMGLMLLLVGCQPVTAPPPAPEQPAATAPVADKAPDAVNSGFYPHMVDLVDEQNGWALSLGHEALYRTADGGQTWINVTPPELDGMPDADLATLSADTALLVLTFRAPPAGEGYAPVVVYRTNDGGRQWERSQFSTPFRTLYGSSVHVLDERRAYVLVEPEHGMG